MVVFGGVKKLTIKDMKKISEDLAKAYQPTIWYEMHEEKKTAMQVAQALGISIAGLHAIMAGYNPKGKKEMITLEEVQHLRDVAQLRLAEVPKYVQAVKRKIEAKKMKQEIDHVGSELLLNTMPVTAEENQQYEIIKRLVNEDVYLSKGYRKRENAEPINIANIGYYSYESTYEEKPKKEMARKWSNADDIFLREHYNIDMTHEEIAKVVNRSKSAVQSRGCMLGLSKHYVGREK